MTTSRVSRVACASSGAVLAALALVAAAAAGPPQIKIGVYSQNEGSGHATAKASITARDSRSAAPAKASPVDLSNKAAASNFSSSTAVPAPAYPTLPATSPLAKSATPFGPGTFWYPGGPGLSCVYAAGSSPLCYRTIGAAGPAAPGVNPSAVASAVAARLDLTPGTIEASPSSDGLTGAPSWFWLDPAPTRKHETITLAGETVTVTATPTTDWAFGDGSTLPDAGGGTRYTPGPPPATAVTHSYQTRCLAGDQGRNPNVLSSCQPNGYRVAATVTWQFSYVATGPINTTGTAPTRTTEADRSYPVSEARAFLVGTTP